MQPLSIWCFRGEGGWQLRSILPASLSRRLTTSSSPRVCGSDQRRHWGGCHSQKCDSLSEMETMRCSSLILTSDQGAETYVLLETCERSELKRPDQPGTEDAGRVSQSGAKGRKGSDKPKLILEQMEDWKAGNSSRVRWGEALDKCPPRYSCQKSTLAAIRQPNPSVKVFTGWLVILKWDLNWSFTFYLSGNETNLGIYFGLERNLKSLSHNSNNRSMLINQSCNYP